MANQGEHMEALVGDDAEAQDEWLPAQVQLSHDEAIADTWASCRGSPHGRKACTTFFFLIAVVVALWHMLPTVVNTYAGPGEMFPPVAGVVELAEAPASCSRKGENCAGSRSCCGDGLQCYEKNEGWAECKAACMPGPDLRSNQPGIWSCKELGKRAPGEAPKCVGPRKDCTASHCCNTTGFTCFEKSDGVGKCKSSCTPGPDPVDVDSKPWTCKALGEETPGASNWVKDECSPDGEECTETMCCAGEGMQCYQKDSGWAQCKYGCIDADKPWLAESWSCKELGLRTPHGKPEPWQYEGTVADWVANECAKPGEDCSMSQCCAEAGMQCYKKADGWAACKASCYPGPDLYDLDPTHWTCEPLGTRTPGYAKGPSGADPVASWVATNCSKENKDCRDTKCCAEEGTQCYQKNHEWAACMKSCDPGSHKWDKDTEPWSCNEFGPRTPRPWGKPSLFCFSVVLINGVSTEPNLMKAQIDRSAGIFACDEFAVFSTANVQTMGIGPLGKVETIWFEEAEIVTSKDGTAGNAELFMHVWDKVLTDPKQRFQACDWTIKVDPDAVLMPERLRWHLEPHTGKKAYIVNCNKPLLPEGPMMFGAMEAFTKKGLEAYFDGVGGCIDGMYWKQWGEDWFMGHCLDSLGVEQIWDFDIYSDGVCTGVDCGNGNSAAFHPKKDVDSWVGCWEQATAVDKSKPDGAEDDGGPQAQ